MRKQDFPKFLLTIVSTMSCLLIQAQSIDTVLSKLDNEYRQEKLYLHYDKPVYYAGETIWFKAYLFANDLPSAISKTLYVELTDAKGKLLQRVTAPVFRSSAAGSLNIPEEINSAVYVRSYTKWMLNFDSSFIYTKAIKVIGLAKEISKPSLRDKTKTDATLPVSPMVLQFFPEGGDLVQGVESRVAFKATDHMGLPLEIEGEIVNSKGKKITTARSVHDGMGTFMLLPESNEQYKAVWKDKQQQLHESSLPLAKSTGIVLEINKYPEDIEFNIKRNAYASPYPFVNVVAQMNQQLLFKAKANIGKTASVTARIPIINLPPGIIQITVFTPDMKPVAERIVFSNLTDYSFITDLNVPVKDLGRRKKNTIQIDVPDTLSCNLSVAVVDTDLIPADQEENIFSRLLLTGDIKGYVHNPAYYFSSQADSVEQHLDLVMMTNGWRRFRWEEVLAGQFRPLRYLPEGYLSIEGKVQGLNKTLLSGKEINGILELKNRNTHFINTPVLPDGRFIIPAMIFYDTAKFFYQFNNDKNQRLTSRAGFDINTGFLKHPLLLQPGNILPPVSGITDTGIIAKNTESYVRLLSTQELQKVKTLKTVVVTTRKKTVRQMVDEEYSSGLFSGGNSRIFIPEEDPSFYSYNNVLDYLRARSAGMMVGNGADPSITWRGSPTELFVNEMPQDISLIGNISMSEIAMIKIFSPPFFGAFGGGAGGAVAIYLKKGVSAFQSVKGLDFITLHGYSPVKEFYSPDYSIDKPEPPDYRNTLYWNPFIITDKNNRRIFLSFYNNDITKKFKVIIEGCNEEGKLTRVEKVLE